MKNVVLSCFCQGSAKKKGLGWAKKIGAMALGLLCLMAPLSVKAQAITQLEYLQWLVQLAGEASLLPQNATAADYVAWARSRNVEPAGGCQPGAAMTQAS